MNILLTSAGRRTYMVDYFKKALNGSGKVFASNSILTHTLLQADEYVLTPNIYDEQYISFLVEYCKQKDINAIISLFDIDLPVLSKNRAVLEKENIQLVVSNHEATLICNDKWATYEFLLSIGISQTPSFITIQDAKEAISKGDISYPLYLKPRWGMGSIGIYKVENDEELDILYKKLHREIFNTYLKYESAADVDKSIIIQQAIKGQEYGIEILNDLNSQYVTTFAKKKIAMRSGETDIAQTVDASEFESIAKNISANLKHMALLDVDCFKTDDGKIFVLEMNCRFGGQYPFSHVAGVNVPQQIVNWLSGKATDWNLLRIQTGVSACKEILPTITSK
ncbi:MAG: ATP-grasp domain-containing protein [Fibrobacter sp.]|nr:ATP-grasp domain-containing protein [Fibrobacter sp.]